MLRLPVPVLMILFCMAAVLVLPVAADDRCPDYCADGITYARGSYDAYAGSCTYGSRTACDYGCDTRGTGCAGAPVTTSPAAARSCPEYCSDGITYSRGTYNANTASCEYSYRTACDNGCDVRGSGCASAPLTTAAETRRSCPEYCSGGTHYFNGAWSSIQQQCTYMTRTCVHGCDGSGTTCARNPAGCPEYCRDGFRHFNGSWNEWAQQCDYGYQEQCLAGCDARGFACAQATATQAAAETGQFITCSADCSCISRQGAADRWGSNVRMCSNSPCGKMDDGTDLYCIRPAAQATAQQTSAGTERFVTCPADCSCISRQGAVDRWQGFVRMCSNSPCGRAPDGTDLYCIRPTEESTAGIRQRYSGPSETVIAVNPVFEGEQMMFLVTRERQAMLLGFIPVRMEVTTRLNATDLSLVREERPWWGFLATREAVAAPATPAPTPQPVPVAGNCTEAPWNGKCYDSAYDLDKDCHMTKDAASSVCGNKIKYPLGTTEYYALNDYEGWLAVYPWDCNDQDPAVWECGNVTAACVNQPYNARCYHSPLDMDADCRMNNVTGLAYCGYEVKDKYGESVYNEWVATYPWDAKDTDPQQ